MQLSNSRLPLSVTKRLKRSATNAKALHRSLRDLLRRFPEDDIHESKQIFIRLGRPYWRDDGNYVTVHEEKYVRAAEWMAEWDEFRLHFLELLAIIDPQNEDLKDRQFQTATADDFLLVLKLDADYLERFFDGNPKGPKEPKKSGAELERLRDQLKPIVTKLGQKHVAAESHVHANTISDFINERTARLKNVQMQRLTAYVHSNPLRNQGLALITSGEQPKSRFPQ